MHPHAQRSQLALDVTPAMTKIVQQLNGFIAVLRGYEHHSQGRRGVPYSLKARQNVTLLGPAHIQEINEDPLEEICIDMMNQARQGLSDMKVLIEQLTLRQ